MRLPASNRQRSAKVRRPLYDTLKSMQPATTEAVSQSFAGMLASLAAPARKLEPDPHDDGLADDVAEFSYEGAQQRARKDPGPISTGDNSSPQMAAEESPLTALPTSRLSITEARPAPSKAVFQDRKAASVTIRLSAAECAQLHARAAESALTVSAYLRSCIFEVESLRTQVKEELVRLRSAAAGDDRQPTQAPAKPGPAPAQGWRSRFIPAWKIGRRLETA